MFLNLKFIHPTRTKRWNWVSLPVSLVWVIAAAWSAYTDFNAGPAVHWALIAASLYLSFAGIAQQIIPARGPKAG